MIHLAFLRGCYAAKTAPRSPAGWPGADTFWLNGHELCQDQIAYKKVNPFKKEVLAHPGCLKHLCKRCL